MQDYHLLSGIKLLLSMINILRSAINLSPTEAVICDIRACNSAIYSWQIIVYICMTPLALLRIL